LQTHFEKPAATLSLRNQTGAFFHCMADRFFQIHIFSGAHRLERRNGVPVIWRGNDHCVYVFPFEQTPKI
jgi:hypothetical protein